MDSNTRRFDPQTAPPITSPLAPSVVPPARALAPLPDPRPALNAYTRRHPNFVPLALIALGVLLWVGRPNFGAAIGAMVPLGLGLVFLYTYAGQQRHVGFLIPGAILSGLGLGLLVAALTSFAGLILVGLGLGFCAIWYQERPHWWALFPGVTLALVGAGLVAANTVVAAWALPLLLVLAGLWLLVSGRVNVRRT